ncbi:SGNH/GDSL hydrolase family protein [Candidatus Woesearchaeota archaeon]|nr:SGNH/GDSL hydrolase family protein [Candidatus Woesearchaeota archaeon]
MKSPYNAYNKIKKTGRKILLSSIISSLFLGALGVGGEIYFRHLAKKERPWETLRHQVLSEGSHVARSYIPGLSYVFSTKGLSELNSWRYHDDEFEVPKPKNTTRITIIGDSMTAGPGVKADEAYPNVLEKILSEHSDKKIDVVNLGVVGYSTLPSYATMKHTAIPLLEPDMIIYAFYVNDLSDTDLNFMRHAENFVGKDGDFMKDSQKYQMRCLEKDTFLDNKTDLGILGELAFFLENNSSFYSELKYRAGILRYEQILPAVNSITKSIDSESKRKKFWKMLRGMPYFYPHAPICRDYATTYKAMEGMAELANEKGIGFMVLDVSGIGNMSHMLSKDFMEYFSSHNPPVKVYSPRDDVNQRAEKRGLNPNELCFEGDPHLSPLGHELIAESVGNYLVQNGLLGH